MKSLNAKRIAAIAASLATGIVFASGVTFSNIPIINSQGQPVVQIVVGGSAQPSDGVVAANIAAVIGNLAFTSTNITATVGNTAGLKCVTTTSSCTLSNQQVWLGEKGAVTATGSYTVKALIGSVLNGAVLNFGTISSSKTLQGSGSYSYGENPASTVGFAVTGSPNPTSAWAGIGAPLSAPNPASFNTNGGGVSFTTFSSGTYYDNVVRFTSSQVPGLMNSAGASQESEYLWLAGFPVFNQTTGGGLQILDTMGAYQVVFGNPLKIFSNVTNAGNDVANHASFEFLGSNWTIYSASLPTAGSIPSSTNFVTGTSQTSGGTLQLAQAITPQQTVYVGHNVTAGAFTVVLQDLSYPSSSGISSAAVAVYKNGVLTNETSIGPSTTKTINASGTKLYIAVGTTFPGLYAYQKWAQIQLFSNVVNVTSGKVFNTNNTNWYAALHWSSNQTSAIGAYAGAGYGAVDQNSVLQGIVLYSNLSKSMTLSSGQSFNLINNPAAWKVTFAGSSLGAPGSSNSNFDAIQFATQSNAKTTYSNPTNNGAAYTTNVVNTYTFNSVASGLQPYQAILDTAAGIGTDLAHNTINQTVVTEPTNLFTVTSQLPQAFTVVAGGSGVSPSSSLSTLTYDLDSYAYVPMNSISVNGIANVIGSGVQAPAPGIFAAIPLNSVTMDGNYIASPFTVTVSGYKNNSQSASAITNQPFQFTAFNTIQAVANVNLVNVTNIQLSYALPAGQTGSIVQVYESANLNQVTGSKNLLATANSVVQGNSVLLGQLIYFGPTLQYTTPNYNYNIAANAVTSTVAYTGQGSNINFLLEPQAAPSTLNSRAQYFKYDIPLITSTTGSTAQSNVIIGIMNQTTVGSGTLYWINSTTGFSGATGTAWEYNSLTQASSGQGATLAKPGFRPERGGQIASISTTGATFDIAKSIDLLNVVVGPASSTVSTTTTNYGPYGVGQATNIANVTIAQVNATCGGAVASSSCTVGIGGIKNLTATPSQKQAIVNVPLNTATTPLAILDSNANQASTLIVVGSKYVNSVAASIFSNTTDAQTAAISSFGPNSTPIVQAFGTSRILVAGYSASQTVQAGNQFIQDLLTNAGH
ncbi:MAG: hypothetical protein KGH61_01295 [Candidatus Micrarchaeota archaeon]|nr:hypothetical protein [Candidatus Micrarchaeota archaeon]MDE1847567.1 hypothetical protein [Candidatus Micrarchaeota archaeon]MDE1864284.1 hypothetical protein [Candidatus Micrarchaeota archaeon]